MNTNIQNICTTDKNDERVINHPFHVFPKACFLNSPIQIYSSVDSITIEVWYNDKVIRTQTISTGNIVILAKLEFAGEYVFKSNYKGKYHEQRIFVNDSYRFGTSTFKKAFLFDDIDYSFLLMEDRMLIYSEKENVVFTENKISPTKIEQINKTNYLLITNNGKINSNFGIYSLESFSLIGELVSLYEEIFISTKNNTMWLRNINNSDIYCFELYTMNGEAFKLIKEFKNVINYRCVDNKLFIENDEQLILIYPSRDNTDYSIKKGQNIAVDFDGFIFNKNENIINYTNAFFDCSLGFQNDIKQLNLQSERFYYLGEIFKNTKDKIISDRLDELENKNNYFNNAISNNINITLKEDENICADEINQSLFPTQNGIFILEAENPKYISHIRYKKTDDSWQRIPQITTSAHMKSTHKLRFINKQGADSIIIESNLIQVMDYKNDCLIVKSKDTQYLLKGTKILKYPIDCNLCFIKITEDEWLFSREHKGKYYIFKLMDLVPILKDIVILNFKYISQHKSILYKGNVKPDNIFNKKFYLKCYSISGGGDVFVDEKLAQHSVFESADDYNYETEYILSSNQIIINPIDITIKDAVVGKIHSTSLSLNKVLTFQDKIFYFSRFDLDTRKYQLNEINIDLQNYNSSDLSPNGELLMLCNKNNEYSIYDISQDKIINFFSEKFIDFTKDGNLLCDVIEDKTRKAKIIDPITLADITPPNYRYYRFVSSDRKLYVSPHKITKYFHVVNNQYISVTEYQKIVLDIDGPGTYSSNKKSSIEEERNRNKQNYFNRNIDFFKGIGITQYSNLYSFHIINKESYITIGVSGTDITLELKLDYPLEYFNYASFSYDNKYLSIVGKPSMGGGFVQIFTLEFDEIYNNIDCVLAYRIPFYGEDVVLSMAVWVCGFSKLGYFAAYDSRPHTGLIKISDDLFKLVENDNKSSLLNEKYRKIDKKKNWIILEGNSFLSFSPSGKYVATSNQGYDPYSLGGDGHQESNCVYLIEIDTMKVVDYTRIKFTKNSNDTERSKNTIKHIAFSSDESKIMVFSSDGVVLVKNLRLDIPNKNVSFVKQLLLQSEN